MTCQKIAYESKHAAKVAKKSCQQRAASEGPLTNRREQRIYRCPPAPKGCGCWHLSSIPKWFDNWPETGDAA